ncbi:hypothetical protein TrCOL_g11125 [Triparma columacea]|uniref:Uncharacterized protein n=1 Tax=Triparma columacea TaxID=722753 RepID=A0A9W7GJM7_9STRA|nr:hypothetical protein TrCOL_g11125 [Triparma columacea]
MDPSPDNALVVYNISNPYNDTNLLKREPQRHLRIGSNLLVISQAWRSDGLGGSSLGFGASVYDAAVLLADYVLSSVPLGGRRVVELGTGTGVVAVQAAVQEPRAAEVVATDGDEGLLRGLTKINLESNMQRILGEVLDTVKTRTFYWGNEEHLNSLAPPFDVVLVADCSAVIYENSFGALVDSIFQLCHGETDVYLSCQERVRSVEAKFFHLLKRKFIVVEVPREDLHRDFEKVEELRLFHLRLKPPI